MTVSATAAATPAAAALAAASTERRSRRDAGAGAAGGAVIRWYRLVAAGESGPARDVRRAGAASASVVSRSMSSSVPLDDRRNRPVGRGLGIEQLAQASLRLVHPDPDRVHRAAESLGGLGIGELLPVH